MITWNEESVSRLRKHVGEGLLPNQIALAMGTTRGSVLSALSRHGLRTSPKNVERELILRLGFEGWSVSRIGRKTGFLLAQIERVLDGKPALTDA